MDDIKKHQRSIALTHTYELLYKEIEPGLAAFRLTTSATPLEGKVPKAFLSKVGTHSVEGVAQTKRVIAFEKGRATAIKTLGGHLVVVGESFLEEARMKGYHEATKEFKHRDDFYTAFVEEGMSLECLVRIDYGNYLLYDRHNGVLPVARIFDYMNGGVHNGRYNLQKALEVLRGNPSVQFVPHDHRDKGEPDSILRIPYYNCDETHQTHLSFRFSPTLEQEQAIWVQQQSYKTEYPSTQWHRAVEDLDLLGLKAAGARLPDKVDVD
jgi:hypothetical protein